MLSHRLRHIANNVFHFRKYCPFRINLLTLLFISHVLHRCCVVFAITFVMKISHESMNNVKPCCFIYNIVIDRSHVRFEGMFVKKNGSITGFMSNVTLLQVFWDCFWLFWVIDSVLCGDVDPYFTVKKVIIRDK